MDDLTELENLLTRTGMSRKNLAHITGYSYNTVRRWTCDKKIPGRMLSALRKHANAVDDIWNNEEKHAHLR